MIDWIVGAFNDFSFTNWMGICLYWIPASLCAYGYSVRTWVNYRNDVKRRREDDERLKTDPKYWSTYTPTDTIGTLIGRALVVVVPVANIWAAAFDVAPDIFSTFFKWVGKVFNQPLVPARKERY